MLSERVLDEISWHSAVSEELCKALWPDLAVESKLQVLEAYQGDRLSPTPDWLTDLALEDGSPAIHYYALRHVHLKTQQENVPEDVKQFYLVTDDELARHAKAHTLKHPLVKAALVKLNTFSATEDLRHLSHFERLVAVRNGRNFSLSDLVDFLDDSLGKVDDHEMAEIAWEFLLRPSTKDELRRPVSYYTDGSDAWVAGLVITKGWDLIRKAGPALADVLSKKMPTALGLGTMEAVDLATMPEHVLQGLVYDNGERKQVRELHRMMFHEPSRFPESVIKTLERHAEYMRDFDPEEVERQRQRASQLLGRSTLEAVQHLQQQLVKLAEQIQELRAIPPPKRGFFG